VGVTAGRSTSVIRLTGDELEPDHCGLSWNAAAWRHTLDVFWLAGVTGARTGAGNTGEPCVRAALDCSSRLCAGWPRPWPWPCASSCSSSGSTSSSRRSAADCACSARARSASSTSRTGAPAGGEPVESALLSARAEDECECERGERGLKDARDGGEPDGGNRSYGAAKESG
jgi:hypothetical protein